MFKFVTFFILPIYSLAQIFEPKNSYELNLYLLSSNAKYPNGVGVSYSSGAKEFQHSKIGYRLQIRKSYKINNVFSSEPGISLSSFSYLNEYTYPPDYLDPRTLSESFKYYYASLDNRILLKGLSTSKIEIYPFVGFYLNVLLGSSVNRTWIINNQLSNGFSKYTKHEDAVNFSYELGVKFVIFPIGKHSIPLSLNYNHFLKEQFDPVAGKRNYAWGFSVGYGF